MLAVLLVIFSVLAFAQSVQLPAPVVQALQAENVPLENVSIYVQRMDASQAIVASRGIDAQQVTVAPQALLSYQSDVPRNPASVMKLLTS